MVRCFEGNRNRAKGIGIILAVFPAASHLTYAAFTAPPADILRYVVPPAYGWRWGGVWLLPGSVQRTVKLQSSEEACEGRMVRVG